MPQASNLLVELSEQPGDKRTQAVESIGRVCLPGPREGQRVDLGAVWDTEALTWSLFRLNGPKRPLRSLNWADRRMLLGQIFVRLASRQTE